VLVVTGVRLARRESATNRKRHKTLAWIFVVCVLVTTALGTAMTLAATPVDGAPTGADAGGTDAPADTAAGR